ncbi:MAG TPA: glucuronate isomerase [Verrucomicrobiae bacterium]|jgi:hypothetical protein
MSSFLTEATRAKLASTIEKAVETTPVYDIHTHLYDPAFGELLLWGVDDLLTYHYLISEVFRFHDLPYEKFWALSKEQQADLVWDQLFLRHSPISEACRGVLTTLNLLGLDVKKRDLPALRKWFAKWKPADYVSHVMEVARVERICMTNSPFDDLERPTWERGFKRDGRFTAALRVDPLVLDWKNTAARLAKWGYKTTAALTPKSAAEARRFLAAWAKRMDAHYCMVSFPPDFTYPGASLPAQVVEKVIMPFCAEIGLPFALMPGVKRAVNPLLRLSGDGLGLSNLTSLSNLCAAYPGNKFTATVLARENQHELCVIARKFRNLHIFGCWWFTNIPSIVEEMTRMRLELLGLSVTPQHSDARVLDQILYKWEHSRRVIARVLTDKYADLAATGWEPAPAEIARDVKDLFGGAFEKFCAT